MGLRYCDRCLTTFREDGSHCPNLGCGGPRPGDGWSQLLDVGDLLDRHYLVEKVLALAGAGATYQAREVDGDGQGYGPTLAVKVLYANRDSGAYLSRLATEAQILRELDHPHIVELQGFVHRRGRPPYLVTTFEHGGDLSRHVRAVGALPANIAAGITRQVLLALDQAHGRGVVHRDLKPQNILLRQAVRRDELPQVRVADFGIAKVSGGMGDGVTRIGAFVGTPEYAAPEQFLGEAPAAATDVFAAGGLLYYLVTGTTPVRLSNRTDPVACFTDLKKAMPVRLPAEVADEPGMDVVQQALDAMLRFEADERAAIGKLVPLLQGLSQREVAPSARTVPASALEDGVTLAPNEMTFLMPPGEEPVTDNPEVLPLGRTMVQTDTPAPLGERTVLPQRTPPPVPERRRLRLSRPADPNALSLEDLFGGPSEPEPEPVQGAPSGLDDLFGGDLAPVPAPEPADFAVPGFPPPEHPAAPPELLPADDRELVRLLGSLSLELRGQVADALGERPAALVSSLRSGGDPRLSEGICCWWLLAPSRFDERTARSLLRDPEPRVRRVVAFTLGELGSPSVLSSLSQLLRDKDPLVRACSAVALGRAAARHQRQSMAQRALKPLARDPDRRVQRAYREAWVLVA